MPDKYLDFLVIVPVLSFTVNAFYIIAAVIYIRQKLTIDPVYNVSLIHTKVDNFLWTALLLFSLSYPALPAQVSTGQLYLKVSGCVFFLITFFAFDMVFFSEDFNKGSAAVIGTGLTQILLLIALLIGSTIIIYRLWKSTSYLAGK